MAVKAFNTEQNKPNKLYAVLPSEPVAKGNILFQAQTWSLSGVQHPSYKNRLFSGFHYHFTSSNSMTDF